MNWYSSKKIWVLITSVVGLLSIVATGEIKWADAVVPFAAMVAAYLGAQGLADLGKGAQQ